MRVWGRDNGDMGEGVATIDNGRYRCMRAL